MEKLIRIDIADIDLQKPLKRENTGVLLAEGDRVANRFGANVFRGINPVDLTEYTMKAYFIRPTLDTMTLDGVIDGNTVYIDLPDSCYASEGHYSLALKIIGDDITQTLRVIDGYIRLTETDNEIVPETEVVSLKELLQRIDEVEAAAERAEAAADRAEAAGGGGTGSGTPGQDGEDGFSPVAKVTQTSTGATISITDATGTTTATITNGKDGQDGAAGKDGASGKDGVSPTITASKSGKVTTLTIKDASGTKTATINDGADGAAGKDGSPGADGKDGASVTVKSVSSSTADGGSNVVTFSDGKTLTVKNGSKGSTGAAGKDGADGYIPVKGVDYFDGTPGVDGYTPVKGTDYYTDAEKAEFTQYIASELAKRGQLTPEYANSIDDCTDESKLYVLPDGLIYAYMAYKTEGGKVPNFTNLMDDAGAYIKEGYRYSSSSAAFKAQASDCAVVIPINADPSANLTIRMRGAQAGAAYASSSYFGPTNQAFPNAQGGNAPVFTTESNGDVTITVKNAAASGTKYGVFHVKAGVAADLIVTLNEEITYTTTEGGTEYRWASTGHAFVPADYEDRIVEVENNVTTHSNQIAALEEKVANIDADASIEAAYSRIKLWNVPVYDDTPVFLLDTPKGALDANTISAKPVAGIYAKYDALMSANPYHITREDCGLASDGTTHIYAYHFKTSVTRDNQGNTAAEQKPVILACSGVHPLEQAGVYSLYNAMEEITTNPKLGDLRRNVHFVVVPMLNPTAVSDTQYHMRNPDGIQVHYNFEVEHGSNGAVQGDQYYGGETPLSIPEAQYFDALMARYQENLACVLSCHNFGQDNARGAGYIWWSCGTTFMVNLGIRFCEKMSDAWHKKYGTTFSEGVQWANSYAVANWGGTAQPAWDMRVGWANLSGSGGTEYRQGMKYGVHGVNVEVCPLCMVLDKDATAYYSSNAMTWGAETYINFFLTYMAAYDPKNKKDYAPNLPWAD